MFCPSCGANIADGTVFCSQCGNQIIPQAAPQSFPAEVPTDGKAITSMVLGIMSLVCLGMILGIPAIILGHISRSNIRKSMGRLKGDGMALAGIILGYISVVYTLAVVIIIAAIAIPNMIREKMVANESSSVATIRTIATSEVQYQSTYPDVGYAPDLASLGGINCDTSPNGTAEHACFIYGPIADPACTGMHWCVKSGYQYMVQADEQRPHQQFVISAIPLEPGKSGNKNYCSTPDGVIRSEASTSRTTPYTADECTALTPLDQ